MRYPRHRMLPGSIALAALLATLTTTTTSTNAVPQDAAEPQRVESKQVEPTLVDQRVADLSPLSVSLRDIEASLQVPMDFEDLFRIPGQYGQDNQYMRSSGALHAVFDRSTYDPMGQAEIPANTMFYIGAPPSAASTSTSGSGGSSWAATAGQSDASAALAFGPSQSSVARDSIRASTSVRNFAAMSLQRDGQTFSSVTRSIPVANAGSPPPSQVVAPIRAPEWRLQPDPEESPTYVNNPTYRAQRIRALIKRAADAERSHEVSADESSAEPLKTQAARGPSSSSD